jgi:hypothetical protein
MMITHPSALVQKFPNLVQKPYIRPVRRENKAMTIAVGFRCSDGIVLCADSQITARDGLKYNAKLCPGPVKTMLARKPSTAKQPLDVINLICEQ